MHAAFRGRKQSVIMMRIYFLKIWSATCLEEMPNRMYAKL